LFVCMTPCSHL